MGLDHATVIRNRILIIIITLSNSPNFADPFFLVQLSTRTHQQSRRRVLPQRLGVRPRGDADRGQSAPFSNDVHRILQLP
jgi:hypothetical protein